jgi:diguanylate cyclase (GGDEF)-like protein
MKSGNAAQDPGNMHPAESRDDGSNQSVPLAKNSEELRAQRVWRLSFVAWCTWLFFLGFFAWRNHSIGLHICAIEVVCITLILEHHRKIAAYRRAMNYTLGACACGIFSVSISSPILQPTMLYFPVSILIASQLLGVREALYWLIVNLFAQTIFYLIISGFDIGILRKNVDEMVMVYGVATCIFFCCQQGEAFYRERTKGLVDLSAYLKKKGETLKELATTDSLTGLMNRYQFLQELRENSRSVLKGGNLLALVLIDMDGFKEINDTMGHPVGDKALTEVALRLRTVSGNQSIIARLGGDEFCLILKDCESLERAIDAAQEIRESMRKPFSLDKAECHMDASLGIALCPAHTQCPTELLAYADTAMFCAKSKRSGIEVYNPEMTRSLIENRKTQDRLSRALGRNEFYLVYQPQVCLNSGRILSVEALIRWKHNGEVIPPVAFIPLLERTGDIVPVGSWVLCQAGEQLRQWSEAGLDIGISINLSSVQFTDQYFEQNVVDPLRRLGSLAQRVDFEITESLLVQDLNSTAARLRQLRDVGATISIDDFGTGYSSLAYLRQLPLDRLKIDRAFVKGIPEDDDGLIAKSITVLAHAMGLRVLAEGVETDDQLNFLKSINCDEYQGYFMSPPIPAEEISRLVTRNLTSLPSHLSFQTPDIIPGRMLIGSHSGNLTG